ncbi:MAG: hypothetical protein JNN18_08360 [Rubrivivax sp.]|nr:hypothetical protein [Rubrivivax sp.]
MTLATPLRRTSAALLLSLAGASQAAIVEGTDVGPFRTFVDTATGTVWADLDNHLTFTGSGFAFRYADRADYLAALQAAGFAWATTTEVAALTAAVPMATTPEFVTLGGSMASLSFGETTTLDGYADVGDGLVQRHYGLPDYGAGTATWAVGGWTPWPSALNDSGLWAYIPGAPGPAPGVPLPGTLALVAAGLCIAARRRGAVRQPAAPRASARAESAP